MGWFEYNYGIVIGDGPADIVDEALDKALAECVKKYEGFTEDQFLATVAFCSGHIDSPYRLVLAEREMN